MTLTEYLFSLRPEQCVEGTRVEWVDSEGGRGSLTFGPVIKAERNAFDAYLIT